MEDGGPTANLIFAVVLFLDIFFFGFGAASRQLNSKEIERRALEDGHKKSLWMLWLINEPGRFINTMQFVVTLGNILMGSIVLPRWNAVIRVWLEGFIPYERIIPILSIVLATLLMLYIILTIGVLVPKKVANRFPEKLSYAGIRIIYFFNYLFLPFTGLVSATSNLILKIFGMKANSDEIDVTEEEIINMVNEGHEQGVIQASEAEMISNIFEYGEKEAQDIMTHRNNIVALDGNMLLKDVLDFVLNDKYSRYPIYEENIDQIIGILHFKDAMRYHEHGLMLETPLKQLTDLFREPEFITETRNIDELFKDMQKKKLQMVIVIDEYGQTAGLVAMEDILEEIVGNIMDEYDEDSDYIEETGNDEYVIEGKTPLEELEERFDISFEGVEFETLNGFMISKLDRIPEEDENFEVEVNGYTFKILSVENRMIQSVLVTKIENDEEKEDVRTF